MFPYKRVLDTLAHSELDDDGVQGLEMVFEGVERGYLHKYVAIIGLRRLFRTR